jgi:hypothetical protein
VVEPTGLTDRDVATKLQAESDPAGLSLAWGRLTGARCVHFSLSLRRTTDSEPIALPCSDCTLRPGLITQAVITSLA